MSFKICFVSPYAKLTELLQRTLGSLSDAPQIVETTMVGDETAAIAAEKQGTEVFVTTDHHARHLRSKVSMPVVTIPLTVFDVTRALNRAKTRYGEPIALLEPFGHNPHLNAMKEVLSCKIKEYIFVDEKDALTKLSEAKRDGCLSAVGGGISAQAANDIDFPCVPLFPGVEAITQAFRQAQQIAEVQRMERYQAMKFKYTVQYAFAGIVVADQYGKITVFNPAAERMLMVEVGQALDRTIEEVLPGDLLSATRNTDEPRLEEIKTIGMKQLVINTVPILDRKRAVGTIFTFREVSQIQLIEEKIRRASHEKGLTAKSTFAEVIARSNTMKEILHRAQRFAASDETILITGETGTGKEIFAQSIHNASRRRARPFVAVSCATIPPSLLESELFGYAEGAFTGARRGGRQGLFELAHGGTIFLDEIGELSPEAQVYLLRVLQERELMRIGDAKVIPIDVRVIAATNKHLEDALEEGRFRLDLYHRLNVLQIALPPLRESFEEILPLVSSILPHVCSDQKLAGRLEEIFSNRKMLLYNHPWPGNIRELQNLIRRIVVSVEGIGEKSFEAEVELLLNQALKSSKSEYEKEVPLMDSGDLRKLLIHLEQEIIRQKSAEFRGNKAQLAKTLGIGRSTLWRKLQKPR
jgi:transcriptional regulator with PAS, ATPase and Fis domain